MTPEKAAAQALGCKCEVCPLQDAPGPVMPERHPGARAVFVGEFPRDSDVKEGRPFTDVPGTLLTDAARSAGLRRQEVYWTNTVLCSPPDHDMKKVLDSTRAENRRRTKATKERKKEAKEKGIPLDQVPLTPMVPTPVEACSARLKKDLRAADNWMVGGTLAIKAVIGPAAKMFDMRGGPITASRDGRTLRIMPTLSPGLVAAQRRWVQALNTDWARFVRFIEERLNWARPNITYHPSPDILRAFLSRHTVLSSDVETDARECLDAMLRCIAIGTDKEVMVVGLRPKHASSPLHSFHGENLNTFFGFYPEGDYAEVIQVIQSWLADPTKVKVGHNFGYYDAICLAKHLGVWPKPIIDTMLLHRLAASELPHSLGFVGSMYTDAPSWKCYDGETEVLTPDGWVRFPALPRGVPVAQWDEGRVSFVVPSSYTEEQHAGPMWSLANQAVDLKVTPGHKMVWRSRHKGDLRVCAVEDLPPTGLLPHVGFKVDGEEIEADWVRLLVAMQADGSWPRPTKDGSFRALDFGFTKHRKIQRLKEILDRLGIPYEEKRTGTAVPRTRIWVTDKGAVERVYRYLGKEKRWGPYLLEWDLSARTVFLQELLLWDGTRGAAHHQYNTADPINASWVQACAAISGQPSRLYTYSGNHHRVAFSLERKKSKRWSRLEGLTREEGEYNGKIYCVTVPSGFLLVRRGGKVTVSGNTDREGRKKALDAENDQELHEYCALDVSITHAALPQLLSEVDLRQQTEVMHCDHKLQYICAGMHWNGMQVDQERRQSFESKVVEQRDFYRKKVVEIAGRDINPGSTQQLRKLLFDEWKLNPDLEDKYKFTSKGDFSTSDKVILACLMLRTLPDQQRAFLEAVRYYRKAQKSLGTYITKLRPSTDIAFGWDEEEDLENVLYLEQTGQQKKGIVDPRTGRMYPGYNVHVATTGRLSSSQPINAQNFPFILRSMVTAAPGHMLVGADADQLELRIAASRWNSVKYLEAFQNGLDPHSSVTALAIFGDRFVKAAGCPPPWPTGTKFKGDAKKLRNLAKIVQYASQYWATLKMIHMIIRQTEQEDPDDPTKVILPHLLIKLKQVRLLYEKWLEGAQFEAGWESELALFRENGFLVEPVMGRRRDFLDGENRNELVNFPIQAAGASLMNLSIIRVAEEIPFEKWGKHTGIVNQCHDSIVVECPLDGATRNSDGEWDVPKGSIPWRVKHIIEEAMNQTHPGLPGVHFTAKADYGLYWHEV